MESFSYTRISLSGWLFILVVLATVWDTSSGYWLRVLQTVEAPGLVLLVVILAIGFVIIAAPAVLGFLFERLASLLLLLPNRAAFAAVPLYLLEGESERLNDANTHQDAAVIRNVINLSAAANDLQRWVRHRSTVSTASLAALLALIFGLAVSFWGLNLVSSNVLLIAIPMALLLAVTVASEQYRLRLLIATWLATYGEAAADENAQGRSRSHTPLSPHFVTPIRRHSFGSWRWAAVVSGIALLACLVALGAIARLGSTSDRPATALVACDAAIPDSVGGMRNLDQPLALASMSNPPGAPSALLRPNYSVVPEARFAPGLQSDSDCQRVELRPVGTADYRMENALGWTMSVRVTENDGLMVRDVQLGQRALASDLSLPYIHVKTSRMTKSAGVRIQLLPSTLDWAASGMWIPLESGSDDPLRLVAVYDITDIEGADPGSRLQIVQDYEFHIENPKDPCEPSEKFPCARFRPLLRYTFSGGNDEKLEWIDTAQRLHFSVDQEFSQPNVLTTAATGGPNVAGVFKDRDKIDPAAFILTTGWGTKRGSAPFIADEENPIKWELCGIGFGTPERVIAACQVAEQRKNKEWDNFHQALGRYAGKRLIVPQCPPCVHIHWRWGAALDVPKPLLDRGPLGKVLRGGIKVVAAIVRFKAPTLNSLESADKFYETESKSGKGIPLVARNDKGEPFNMDLPLP